MTTVIGYSDRVGVAPGETIEFKVSCEAADSYHADIVRLMCPEAGPDARAYREELVDVPVNGTYAGQRQDIAIGSYAVVPGSPLFDEIQSFTLQAYVWPTTPGRGWQALLGTWSEAAHSGFGLALDAAGALEFRMGDGTGEVARFSTGVPLRARYWYRVGVAFDAATGAVRLVQNLASGQGFVAAEPVDIEGRTKIRPDSAGRGLLFAAWHEAEGLVGGHYNGKIDRPRLASCALDRSGMDDLSAGDESAAIGIWDFSRDISSERITDLSPNTLHGETVNLPARAMTGHNWTGAEMNWQNAPEQYGAIHFHDDDLYDAGWNTDFALTIPSSMSSGIYAARLRADDAEFHMPFFVRPVRGRTNAPIAYLASTATYQAYLSQRGRFVSRQGELMQGRLTVLDATDILLLDHPEIGSSMYDRHSDGSGVCYASRLRPATNIRPKGRLWNFSTDLFVIDWLEHAGLAYDVITDEDLDAEGLDLIADYRVIVTGSHPEYHSKAMLDALESWLARGGRLMYLGGNGFYWRIAYHPSKPGVIELRRAEDGTRAWVADVGEYYHSFTGEYGGLWRRQGRAPNRLCGVGFISQGFDASSYYRRTQASRDPRVGFMFDGIEDEILGDFGIVQGGAAGIELDSFDPALGSPPHALVVASSENHSNVYTLVAEEVAFTHGALDATLNPAIRADMLFFETDGGGAVFSTGSIAYAGSLGIDDFDNNIATLTTNVLRRFADPEPFEMPSAT